MALSEEEFKKLGICGKMGYINRLLCYVCKQNNLFPVLFFASSVTRLYYVLFSTFWVLYLTSYVGDILENDDEVSSLYANLMLCSVTIGLTFSPLIGAFSDRISPSVTLPLTFIFRAIGVALFIFIENPKHVFAYAVGTWLVLGTTAE